MIETRAHEVGEAIRRRRQCVQCKKRFTTYERSEQDWPKIVKKDGSREDYAHSKLLASFTIALRKRPVPNLLVESAIDRIESHILQCNDREIASHLIGQMVMTELSKLDKVAYVRFASVYRNFTDLGDFAQAISEVDKKKQ